MLKHDNIPVLTDLIEEGIQIQLSELGLDSNEDLIIDKDDREEPQFDNTQAEFDDADVDYPLPINPALEQSIRRILDEHLELAWQEIKIAIQQTGRDENK
jgi:hypothetical protein